MLKKTFCHIPGIGAGRELSLWSSGVRSWDDLLKDHSHPLDRSEYMRGYIEESKENLDAGNPRYFSRLLHPSQIWRIFPEFRRSTAYLDIETTGLHGPGDYITTISVYDGDSVYCYVKGQNLDEFKEAIKRYRVLVTYNGKCFDVPFIEGYLGTRLDQAHIDLRYVMRSLGFTGGLKGCEKRLGIERGDLDGVDGYFAVLLWNDYMRSGDPKSLETLLAYNIADVVNLERLMVMAYNMKLRETPFWPELSIELPLSPRTPFRADRFTIERILSESFRFSPGLRV